jgi:hypothetical protein
MIRDAPTDMTQTELVRQRGDGQGWLVSSEAHRRDRLGYYWYRLFATDGSEIGEAAYAGKVSSGDLIWTLDGRELRVTALVLVDDERSPYTALLQVEAA